MEYTDEQMKQMVHMGILGYPVEKCINILDITDENKFRKDFNDPGSAVAKAYKKGVDKGDYQIDMTLYKKASEGDLSALKAYERRR